MKTALLSAALFVLAAAPSFSETVLGCEIVDMGGYSNKADPSCVFTTERTGSGTRLVFGDFDADPETPDTLGQKDT